jgi:DNA-binding transcriptional MerR regulator
MPRLRPSRAARQADASGAEFPIPDKLYFRIGEVSKLAQTKPYVLRYWETEFPTLKPMKSRSGHRLYRRQDVEMVLQIRHLLYERGFTIEGARQQLADKTRETREQKQSSSSTADGARLKAIKRELESILTILSQRC